MKRMRIALAALVGVVLVAVGVAVAFTHSAGQTAVTDSGVRSGDAWTEPTQDELVETYGPFGISFDDAGNMLYEGKRVRWFADCVEVEDGALSTRYVYRNDRGTEYLRTVRDRLDNGDGSYDPFGPLTGIVPWEAGEWDTLGFLFESGPIEAVAEATGGDGGGVTFAQRFAAYKDFGITYEEADNASGAGDVYWNGQLVSVFADVSPSGGAFSFHSATPGGISVRTVYDQDGTLTGVEETAGASL